MLFLGRCSGTFIELEQMSDTGRLIDYNVGIGRAGGAGRILGSRLVVVHDHTASLDSLSGSHRMCVWI